MYSRFDDSCILFSLQQNPREKHEERKSHFRRKCDVLEASKRVVSMAECVNEEEVELSLGLTIGGGSLRNCSKERSAMTEAAFDDGIRNDKGDVVVQAALRRQEARKKQRVRRGDFKPKNAVDDDDDDDDERVQKKIKSEFWYLSDKGDKVREVEGLDLNKCGEVGADLVLQFPMRLQHLAAEARELRSGDGNQSFRSFQAAEKKGSTSMEKRMVKEEDGAVKVHINCSSPLSENTRLSSQDRGSISSSDSGSLSSQQKSPTQNAQVAAVVDDEQSQFFHSFSKVVALDISAPAAANSSAKNVTSRASMAQLPCVSTTGNCPGGTTVRGFLYRYTRDEVCIVCVCHGYSFSPAKFVEHAGGRDVKNPLRHITVLPSAPTKPATNF